MAFKTLETLLSDTRDLINDPTTDPAGNTLNTRWSNASIVSKLNDGCMDIIAKSINQENSPWTGSFTTDAGGATREYRLTTYPMKVLWLSLVDSAGNETVLTCVERSVLDQKVSNWRGDSSGTPILYFIEGDVITFYYTPSAAFTINYGYIRMPNIFSADTLTTEPFNGELALYPLQPAIPLYAAKILSFADEKNDKALIFASLYQNEIKAIRKYLENRETTQRRIKLGYGVQAAQFPWTEYKSP